MTHFVGCLAGGGAGSFREPCLQLKEVKDAGWDTNKWEPLVQERAFVEWLVRNPSDEEVARSRPITVQQAVKLEVRQSFLRLPFLFRISHLVMVVCVKRSHKWCIV